MRIYKVTFWHTRYGERWESEQVAVRGFVPEAIRKALQLQNGQAKHLRVESVELIANGR